MGRNRTGWVKMHRQTTDLDIGQDLEAIGLWTTLIMWANWGDGKSSVHTDEGEVCLNRGQIKTTIRELALHFRCDKNKIARLLGRFRNSGRIGTKSGTTGTIITILKYDVYQGDDEASGTRSDTLAGHERDSKKKERKKEENTEAQASLLPPDPRLLDPGTRDLLERCTPKMVDNWLTVYHDSNWIKRELAKCWSWYLANPKTRTKAKILDRFVNNWLMRGFEKARVQPGFSVEINTRPLTEEELNR